MLIEKYPIDILTSITHLIKYNTNIIHYLYPVLSFEISRYRENILNILYPKFQFNLLVFVLFSLF